MAGVEGQLRAWYPRGQQAGVLRRDRDIGISVMNRCRHGDGTELEPPGSHEHPQILGDSPAALAEGLSPPGQESLAPAGPLERAPVDAGQPADGKAMKLCW